MNTAKPFSNISYNTDAFMEQTLHRLIKAKVISFACWIRHQPDEDDKKSHIHVYFEPSKRLQTDDLKDEFMELDPDNEKPLGVTAKFYSSKWDDWYLYGLHDKKYLVKKHLTRNVHYVKADMHPTDSDAFEYMVQHIDLSDAVTNMLVDCAQGVESLPRLIATGQINYRDARNAEYAIRIMQNGSSSDTIARDNNNLRRTQLYDDIRNDNNHMSTELDYLRTENAKLRQIIDFQNKPTQQNIDTLEDFFDDN